MIARIIKAEVSASADNTNRGLDNFAIMRKSNIHLKNSIIISGLSLEYFNLFFFVSADEANNA